MASWVQLGVGPWFVMGNVEQTDTEFRGELSAPMVSFAFANSGELQIELIQQHDECPSVYREFLDAGGEGFHHIAFWTRDVPVVLAAAEKIGWPTIQRGNVGGAAEFAYVDAGRFSSTVVEVMELNQATGWLAATVRDAAADWDGTEPVRSLF